MRRRASYLLFILSLLLLAGCGARGQTSGPPPLVFPTANATPAGPTPLSLYFSLNSSGGSVQHSIGAVNAITGRDRWLYNNKTLLQSPPLLESGTVYVASADDNVYALNAGDGSVRWQANVGGFGFASVVANGMLYVANAFQSSARNPLSAVYALNTTDGKQVWKAPVVGFISAVENGIVYVSGNNQYLYALKASDGSQLWRAHTDAPNQILQTDQAAVYVLSSAPNSNVFSGNAALYAINISDGSIKWRYPAGPGLAAIISIGVANGLIYFITNDNGGFGIDSVTALQTSDGTQRWHTELSVNASFFSGWLDNDTIYLGSNDSNVYTLNAKTGAKGWRVKAGNSQQNVELVDNGVVYVTSLNEGLTALKASDGTVLWRYPINEGTLTVSQVTGGLLYGSYYDSSNPAATEYLFALNTSDGSLKWRYDVGESFLFSLVFPIVG